MARPDVPLCRPHDRRRYRGGGSPGLCRDAGSGFHPGRRISLHPSRRVGRALCQHRRIGRAHRGCGAGQRHRPDIAAGILRPCRLRWSRSRARSAAFHQWHRRIFAADGGQPPRRGGAAGRGGRARTALVAGGNAGGTRRQFCSSIGMVRCISILPNKSGKSTNASNGAASGRCSGCSTMSRSIVDGA